MVLPPFIWIGLVCTVVGATTGFWAGFEVKSTIEESKLARDLLEEKKQLVTANNKNKELVHELMSSQARVEVVHEIIEKEVPVYVTKIQKEYSDCNITNGTVRMLHNASTNMSGTSERAVNKVRESSEITEEQLIKYTAKLLHRIHRDKEIHNPLVQWHLDKEKVDTNGDKFSFF